MNKTNFKSAITTIYNHKNSNDIVVMSGKYLIYNRDMYIRNEEKRIWDIVQEGENSNF